MHRHTRHGIALVAWALAQPAGTQAGEVTYPAFDDPHLIEGRALWLSYCVNCHGDGTAGAPMPTVASDWKHRLEKPRALLYRHAIEGFFGPMGTMMPPRGGADHLSDAEIHAAVDYMIELARSHQHAP